MTAGAKNKGGRPPALKPDARTLKQIRGLGQIQATTKECAAVLGVSEPTFIKFKKDNPEAAEAFECGQAEGRASLRRMQFDAAKKGNATMLIWLGKQLLDQKDKQDITAAVTNNASEDERTAIDEIHSRLDRLLTSKGEAEGS